MRLKYTLAGLVAGLATAAPVSAHTSYLLPNTFDATHARMITLESSFTEDFSRPEVGIASQDWHIITPDGARAAYDNVVELKQITLLEAGIGAEGTYRFTTGERLGRSGKMIKAADGSYRPALQEGGGEVKLAAGESLVTSQTATVAEVYVTRGAPTDTAVNAPAGRLVIRTLTHPNALFANEAFTLQVSFDGKPLAGVAMELEREGGMYDDAPSKQELKTDAEGKVELKLDKAGVYLLMTRHQSAAPAGSETEIRSYTTSLTFEVAS